MALFGSPLFSLYAIPTAGTFGETVPMISLFAWLRRLIAAAAGLASASGVVLLGCTAAEMSGDPAAAWHGDALRLVLFDTQFGGVWQLQFAIAVLLLVFSVCVPRVSRKRLAVVVALSAALLVSQASIGHASMGTGTSRLFHLTNQSIHLAAAASWLGGLLPLGFLLASARRDESEDWGSLVREALSRFSRLGMLMVVLLLLTGMVNSCLLVGSAETLLGTRYGHVLLLKIGLFAIMVALALVNRFLLVPRIRANPLVPNGSARVMAALWRNVLAEQGLGVFVLTVVSILGTLPPGSK
jgi:putative copper resistance protein D